MRSRLDQEDHSQEEGLAAVSNGGFVTIVDDYELRRLAMMADNRMVAARKRRRRRRLTDI